MHTYTHYLSQHTQRQQNVPVARKTKIVCTLGPACWSEEGLAELMDAGMNVARFNFSHGDHAGHKAVLDRVRAVAAAKGKHVALALDTKGPEIRTAMLRGGKDILLEEGEQRHCRAAAALLGAVKEGRGRVCVCVCAGEEGSAFGPDLKLTFILSSSFFPCPPTLYFQQ